MINKRMFDKVKARILAEPEMFYMGDWIGHPTEESLRPSCGTTCCIGGHAAVEEGWRIITKEVSGYGLRNYFISPDGTQHMGTGQLINAAKKALGIDDQGENNLFYVDGWPSVFQEVENSPYSTPQMKAENAVARIDHFLATGE